MPDRTATTPFRRASRLTLGRDNLLSLIEIFLEPLVLVISLWVVALAIQGRMGRQEIILSLIVFSLTFPGSSRLTMPPRRLLRHVALGWFAISGLLLLFGYGSRYIDYFDPDVLITWWWTAPLSLLFAHFLMREAAPRIRGLQGHPRRVVIAGRNEQGIDLVQRLVTDPYSNIQVLGFFDDRVQTRTELQVLGFFDDHDQSRTEHADKFPLLGKISELPAYAKNHGVDVIYLSLPMASQHRILSLLEALRDTTSSIYFVPDTFITDLIQGRVDTVGGVPVVAVCETPFTGMNGIIKRGSDIVLALLILALIAPLLILIALGVKLSSRGPAIFRQRRYGLDGHEIVVYKFRSMRALDDGSHIEQVRKGDPRVTPLGAFLRRTSLDELPQFFNVLQGRMSIVGPRPHAVAHNEMYRKLIKGYMLRHKVKPGITGWAQVNGLRGETETLEKMKARIDYDLEYLRSWSLRLDLFIITKTVWVVLKGGGAY